MEDLHKEFTGKYPWYAKWHTVPFVTGIHFALLFGIGYNMAVSVAEYIDPHSASAAVAQAAASAQKDDASALAPRPGTDFGPWFKISQWKNCAHLHQQGRIFELQNAVGQSMWSECTPLTPKAPVGWNLEPVRFRLVKEPLPRHSDPHPHPALTDNARS